MEKQKTQIIITALLIVMLAALVLGNMKSAKKNPAASTAPAKEQPPAQNTPQVSAAPEEVPGQKVLESQKERSKIAWGRNPFSIPKASKEFQKASLELKGISLGKDKNAFAFINTEIVKAGDKIGSYEVVEIEKDRVMLRKDGQSFYITMPEE